MDKKLQFTGGEPDVRQNQLTIDADANRPAMFGMVGAFERITGNYTVYGCVVTVGGSAPTNTWSLTTGYIYLNNELVQVDAQSGTFDSATEFLVFTKSVTYNPLGDKTFIDATPRQTWQVNRGVISVLGSVAANELDAINGDRQNELVLFRKDIISASQTSQTVDFSSDEDLIRVDLSAVPSADPVLSIINVINGDTSKFIEITKTSVQDLDFTDATDITNNARSLTTLTTVVYQVYNKNGVNYVKALAQTSTISDWQTPSYNAGFTAGTNAFQYRLKNGNLEFRGDIDSTGASGTAFTLAAGYRPSFSTDVIFFTSGASPFKAIVAVSGAVSSIVWSTVDPNSFNNVIIID